MRRRWQVPLRWPRSRVLPGCANGALELLRVKPDGKREMDASAWVQGLHGGNGATWERA